MRYKLLLLLILPLLILGGCQRHTEIGDLAVILGVAVSESPDGSIAVTVELAHRDSINGEDRSVVVSAAAADWDGVEEALAKECDTGVVELFNEDWLDGAVTVVENIKK